MQIPYDKNIVGCGTAIAILLVTIGLAFFFAWILLAALLTGTSILLMEGIQVRLCITGIIF